MKLIDTHCHPQLAEYDADRREVIQRSLDADIGLIAVGTTLVDSVMGVRLAELYPNQPVYAAVGVHPTDEDLTTITPGHLEALLGSRKIVAIGETGLDYFHVDEPADRDLQADIFEQHIIVSQQANLPLIVHCRDKRDVDEAYAHVLTLLTRHQVKNFVMHCFSGDWSYAEKFLDLGGYLSFTGIVTFPKSEMMQTVVKNTPAERMMIETDAPFLAPEPHRGKRNEPGYVEFVAKKIADLRDASLAEIAELTTSNAKRFFNITP